MVGRGRSGVPGLSLPTSFMPTISVQNVCDSSMSRTLRTRWLTPTGVTARSGAAILLSAIVEPFRLRLSRRYSWRRLRSRYLVDRVFVGDPAQGALLRDGR